MTQKSSSGNDQNLLQGVTTSNTLSNAFIKPFSPKPYEGLLPILRRVRPIRAMEREWWAIDLKDTYPGMVMDLQQLGFEAMAWEEEVLVRFASPKSAETEQTQEIALLTTHHLDGTSSTIVEDLASFLEEAAKDTPSSFLQSANLATMKLNISDSFDSHFPKIFLYFSPTLIEEMRILNDEYDQYRRIYGGMDIVVSILQVIERSWLVNIETKKYKELLTEVLLTIFKELEKLNINSVISATRMKKLVEAIQGVKEPGAVEISPAMLLDQRLENSGAYNRLKQFDPRRATMLHTYLTTDKSALDVGKEVGLNSRSRSTELLHSAMELAFFALPEDQRAEYANNPAKALQTRSKQQTNTKSQRIKDAHSKRPRNPETGRIELSGSPKENIGQAATRRWQQYREGNYTGKPVGRPRTRTPRG